MKWNGFEVCTSGVQDSKPVPTSKWEPLATLTNWEMCVGMFVNFCLARLLTVDFPVPVAPITLFVKGSAVAEASEDQTYAIVRELSLMFVLKVWKWGLGCRLGFGFLALYAIHQRLRSKTH